MIDADQQRDELVERLFAAGLGMAEVLTVYLGDTLGLYRALERAGPMTAPELAKETGTFERYAREWLEQQAAAGILDGRRRVRGAGRTPVRAPAGSHRAAPRSREPLLDRAVLQVVRRRLRRDARPRLRVPLRRAGPVERVRPRHGRGAGRLQPAVARRVARHRVPALDPRPPRAADRRTRREGRGRRVRRRLGRRSRSPARIRTSRSTASISDEPSIEIARRNAEEAGARGSGPVRGEGRRGSRAGGRYDLAIVVEAIHDLPHPVAVLRSIREMLKPGGTLLVADERTEDVVHGTGERDRAALLRVQRPVLPAVRDGGRHVGGNRHRDAAVDVRGLRGRGRVRRGLRPADRARLPPLLSARSLSLPEGRDTPR